MITPPTERLANRLTEIKENVGPEHGSGYAPATSLDFLKQDASPEERTARDVVRMASAIAEGAPITTAASGDNGEEPEEERALAKQRAFQQLIMQSSRVQARAGMVEHQERPALSPSTALSAPTSEVSRSARQAPDTPLFPNDSVRRAAQEPVQPQLPNGAGPMPAILKHQPETYAPELRPEVPPPPQKLSLSGWRDRQPAVLGAFGLIAFAAIVAGSVFEIFGISDGDRIDGARLVVPSVVTSDKKRVAERLADPTQIRAKPKVTTVKTVAVDPGRDTATIKAVSGRAFALPITLAEPIEQGSTESSGFIRIDNLPTGSRVSVGKPLGGQSWAVPEEQADQILLILTLNSITKRASHEIVAQHTGADKVTPLGPLQTYRVTVSQSVKSVTPKAPAAAPVAKSAQVADSPKVLSQTEVRRLIVIGNSLMREGKVAEAREKFAEATLSNIAEADLAMGQAYDAFYLSKVAANAQPNEKRARFWYRKAAEKGSLTATRKLERLGS